MVHLLSPELIPRGSPFWRLNASKINSQFVNTLTHALAPLAHLDPLSILDRRESKTLYMAFSQVNHLTGRTRRSSWAITPLTLQQSDPLKAQYEKRLLLGCISADRACELPSPLISYIIDHHINENHILGVHCPDGSVST